jgi:hypothetical protein
MSESYRHALRQAVRARLVSVERPPMKWSDSKYG